MLKKVVLLLGVLGVVFAALMLTSRNADFSQQDSLEMAHSASMIWSTLIDAPSWPQWWPGMEGVILDGEMREGARIDLFLTGIPDGEPAWVNTVRPLEEISWERAGVLGSFTRTTLRLGESQGGTIITIESHIAGPQAVLARFARRDDFARYHEVVLRSLKLHLDRSAASFSEERQ